MNETTFLKLIFRNFLEVKNEKDKLVYKITFKQKTFEFVCSPLYPGEVPVIRSPLTDEQLNNVYERAKGLLNSPMIYDLVLACVKQDELDLVSTLSTPLVVDYDLDEAPRITEEQFFNWVKNNQAKEDKVEKKTGRLIFELGRSEGVTD